MMRRHEYGGYLKTLQTSTCRRSFGDVGDRRIDGRIGVDRHDRAGRRHDGPHRGRAHDGHDGRIARRRRLGGQLTEAEAFCTAAVTAIAAFNSEDEAQIGPAAEALIAAAPEEVAPAVGELMANPEAEPGDPAFDEPYAAMFDYLRGNCGYAEANVAGTEYAFGGLPAELPAGPIIISLENIGEQVHELILIRVNDDVTLTLDELLALPEEESNTMATPVGFLFAFPGTAFDTVLDLTPGRYVALCFLPEGATPEIISQMGGPEDTAPPGAELGPPHFTLGMVQEITVA